MEMIAASRSGRRKFRTSDCSGLYGALQQALQRVPERRLRRYDNGRPGTALGAGCWPPVLGIPISYGLLACIINRTKAI